MYKICFYAPDNFVEAIKDAMFTAGAGHIGNYRCAAWQIRGETQFLPDVGSQPFIGDFENLTRQSEYKVEMVCDDQHIKAAIAALKEAHPYEQPAYHVIKLEDF